MFNSCIGIDDSHRLLLHDMDSTLKMRILCYHLIANQNDVGTHIQRIQLCISLNDATGLPGAMVDLYIALGEQGYDIRRQMLRESYPLLSESMVELLYNGLIHGLGNCDPVIGQVQGALLSHGFIGISKVVNSHTQRVENHE